MEGNKRVKRFPLENNSGFGNVKYGSREELQLYANIVY
jgi:hypothetical protein